MRDGVDPAGDGPRPLGMDASAGRARLAAASAPALVFDYDGTLTPLAPSPQSVEISPRVVSLLEGFKGRGVTLGILSGRALSDLREHVPLQGVTLAGNRGLEMKGPGGSWRHPEAVRRRPVLRALAASLREAFREAEGVWVEDKGLSLSLPYRDSPPERAPAIWSKAEAVTSAFSGIRPCQGKTVIEFRPDVAWDKGSFLLRLKEEWRPGWVLYAGDDETDEDAFRAMVCGGWRGTALRVGGGFSSTRATHWAKDPEEVLDFLSLLLSAKRDGP